MLDPDDLHHPALDAVAHDVRRHSHQFADVSTSGASAMWMESQGFDGGDQSDSQTLRRDGANLSDIGADAFEITP